MSNQFKSAIKSALGKTGKEVRRGVSVPGFDNVYGAKFHNPALLTVRRKMMNAE